jgi:hypothetical protein
MPNRYDDDEQRLRRLEAQEQTSRRRSLLLALCGMLTLAALVPLAGLGWSGAGLMLAPIGIGLILVAGIQLLLARFGD